MRLQNTAICKKDVQRSTAFQHFCLHKIGKTEWEGFGTNSQMGCKVLGSTDHPLERISDLNKVKRLRRFAHTRVLTALMCAVRRDRQKLWGGSKRLVADIRKRMSE